MNIENTAKLVRFITANSHDLGTCLVASLMVIVGAGAMIRYLFRKDKDAAKLLISLIIFIFFTPPGVLILWETIAALKPVQ